MQLKGVWFSSKHLNIRCDYMPLVTLVLWVVFFVVLHVSSVFTVAFIAPEHFYQSQKLLYPNTPPTNAPMWKSTCTYSASFNTQMHIENFTKL